MFRFMPAVLALVLMGATNCSTVREVVKFDSCKLPPMHDGAKLQALTKSFVEGQPNYLGTYTRQFKDGPRCYFTVGSYDCETWEIVFAQCDDSAHQ